MHVAWYFRYYQVRGALQKWRDEQNWFRTPETLAKRIWRITTSSDITRGGSSFSVDTFSIGLIKRITQWLLVGGCIKFWNKGGSMYKTKVSNPVVTMNVSISDHCQRWGMTNPRMFTLFTDNILSRVIFEEPPLTIHGVCVATSIAGVGRHFFKIKLLRYLSRYWILVRRSKVMYIQHCKNERNTHKGLSDGQRRHPD